MQDADQGGCDDGCVAERRRDRKAKDAQCSSQGAYSRVRPTPSRKDRPPREPELGRRLVLPWQIACSI